MLERDEYGFPIPPGTVAAPPPPPPKAAPAPTPADKPPDHPCVDDNQDGTCDQCGQPCDAHPGGPNVPPAMPGRAGSLARDEYGFRIPPAQTAAKPSPKSAPDRPQSQRDKDEKSGVAMEGGRFPIRNCGDAENARQALGRTKPSDRDAVRAHIAKRVKALGCPSPGD